MLEEIKAGLLCICGAVIFLAIIPVVFVLYLIEEKPWRRRLSEEEKQRLEEKFRLGYISII